MYLSRYPRELKDTRAKALQDHQAEVLKCESIWAMIIVILDYKELIFE